MSYEHKDRHWLECYWLISRPIRTSDNHHIGNIQAISKELFVIKCGFLRVHYYYIPRSKALRYSEDVLWLKIKENEVKEKYERNKSPDPFRYYVKDYPYTIGYFPPLAVVKNRWTLSKYHKRYLNPLEYFNIVKSISPSNYSTGHICDLCGSKFSSSEKLSCHINMHHN